MIYSMHKSGVFKKTENLFLIGYFLFIINQIFAQSQLNNINFIAESLKVFRWALIFYFIILILVKNKYPQTLNGFAWIFFMLIALIEMLFFDGKLLLLMLIIFVFASYKYNIERIIKMHIKALVLGDIFIVGLSIIGILNIGGTSKSFDNLTGFMFKSNNITYTYGFTASNVVPITFLFVYLFILLIQKGKYNKYYDLLVIFVDFFLYFNFGSRSGLVLVIIAVILRWVISIKEKKFIKLSVPICYAILGISLFFSVCLPTMNANKLINKVDVLLTARLTIMRNALRLYPMTLWGYGETYAQNIEDYLVLDNGYISLFIQRGILIGIAFMKIIMKIIKTSKKQMDAYLLLFITVWILGNIIDATFLHYVTFPIYAMIFNIDWYSKEQNKYSNKET